MKQNVIRLLSSVTYSLRIVWWALFHFFLFTIFVVYATIFEILPQEIYSPFALTHISKGKNTSTSWHKINLYRHLFKYLWMFPKKYLYFLCFKVKIVFELYEDECRFQTVKRFAIEKSMEQFSSEP